MREEPVATKIMRKIKSFWIAIIVIISFLFIKVSYNGTPPISVFSSLIAILYQLIDKGWDFSLENFTMNFTYTFVEFLLTSVFLLYASITKNARLTFIALILFVLVWSLWLYSYKPYIDISLYLMSSIPFLILLGCYIIYLKKGLK